MRTPLRTKYMLASYMDPLGHSLREVNLIAKTFRSSRRMAGNAWLVGTELLRPTSTMDLCPKAVLVWCENGACLGWELAYLKASNLKP